MHTRNPAHSIADVIRSRCSSAVTAPSLPIIVPAVRLVSVHAHSQPICAASAKLRMSTSPFPSSPSHLLLAASWRAGIHSRNAAKPAHIWQPPCSAHTSKIMHELTHFQGKLRIRSAALKCTHAPSLPER